MSSTPAAPSEQSLVQEFADDARIVVYYHFPCPDGAFAALAA